MSQTTARAIRTEQIILRAFETWGRSIFYNTRLEAVARRLGLTKPALYRYFTNKQRLLEAMESRLVEEMQQLTHQMRGLAGYNEPWEALRRIIRVQTDFYGARIYYFYFLAVRVAAQQGQSLLPIIERHHRLLEQVLRDCKVANATEAAHCVLYTVAFFLIRTGLTDEKAGVRPRNLSVAEREALADQIYRVSRQGYGAAPCDPEPDFREIENSATIGSDVAPETNRVFRAIAETVAEQGLAEASTDKIARRAGITKSSLYFYFRNRDDMLGKLIGHHHERVYQLFTERVVPYERLADQLYCHMVVTASYFAENRPMVRAVNWFRFQGVQVKVVPPTPAVMAKRYSFITRAIESGQMVTHDLSLLHMTGHLNFLVVNRMMSSEIEGRPPLVSDMRPILQFFLNGIRGVEEV